MVLLSPTRATYAFIVVSEKSVAGILIGRLKFKSDCLFWRKGISWTRMCQSMLKEIRLWSTYMFVVISWFVIKNIIKLSRIHWWFSYIWIIRFNNIIISVMMSFVITVITCLQRFNTYLVKRSRVRNQELESSSLTNASKQKYKRSHAIDFIVTF